MPWWLGARAAMDPLGLDELFELPHRRYGHVINEVANWSLCALSHSRVTRFKLSPWQGGFIGMNASAH
jgi:hypothetical protein